MSEEFNLVKELALILISAGLFTIISKALKQPLILGYIVAGFIIGPHLGLFPKFADSGTVDQWSELGIIFMLFSLGLEFSFKKLFKIGGSALTVAMAQFIGMFTLGIVVGSALSWTTLESVFLGGMMSMSSTAIIIKAYGDMGLKKAGQAPLVFGALVFQDMIAVLLLVLLSTLAVSDKFAGGEMLLGLAKLAFFMILWFLVGIYLIPTLLKKASAYLNDEILLITALGLCFGMVTLANLAGFSSALGAFVMGSLLAETLQGERIHKLTQGIKDMFSAIFFVSVGMMVDPAVIAQYWPVILLLTVVAMVGIVSFATSGALIAGQGLERSVLCGFSLAQLGEFSFIIASLGCSMGVLRGFIYPVIVTVSVITTFTTPYMIKAGQPAYKFLSRKLPARFVSRVDSALGKDSTDSCAEQTEWKRLIKAYLLRIVLYGVILIAILMGSQLWLDKFIVNIAPESWSDTVTSLITVVVTLVTMSPFLAGIAVIGKQIARSSKKLIQEKRSNFWPVISMALFRIFLAIAFVIAVIAGNFHLSYWAFLLIAVAGLVFFLMASHEISRFSHVEQRFIENLNFKDEYNRRMTPVGSAVNDKLSHYDIHTQIIQVPADTNFAGRKLRDTPFRHESGANIVRIMRGSRSIFIPSGDEMIFPYDNLVAVGTGEQLAVLESIISREQYCPAAGTEPADAGNAAAASDEFELEQIELCPDSYLTGKSLAQADMRSYGCMVISVIRDGNIITNPSPDMIFRDRDIVWLAGEKSACDWWQ